MEIHHCCHSGRNPFAFEILAEGVKEWKKLKHLAITHEPCAWMQGGDVTYLLDALVKCPDFRVLELRNCALHVHGGPHLGQAMQRMTQANIPLERMVIDYARLGWQEIGCLMQNCPPTVKEFSALGLRQQKEPTDMLLGGIQHLVKGSLTSLTLGDLNARDKYTAPLFEALVPIAHRLEQLHCPSALLKQRAAMALESVVQLATSLTSLDLSDCKCSESTIGDLVDNALYGCQGLKVLRLARVGLTSDTAMSVFQYMAEGRWPHLEVLNIARNELCNFSINSLTSKTLEKCSQLREMDLRENEEISDCAWASFAKTLILSASWCPKLRKVWCGPDRSGRQYAFDDVLHQNF